MLPDAIAWIVHPAAGFALAHFASVLYSRQGKQAALVLRAAAIIALLAVLGAGWVVHPAAGMLLGAFGLRGFRGRVDERRALGAVLLSAVVFMVLGAGWVIFPLAVMSVIWVFVLLMSSGARSANQAELEAPAPVQALPERAGGLPLTTAPQPVAVPVGAAVQGSSTPPPRAVDAFTALQLDDRLPGDIRAQLVALDLRTAEALAHLKAIGQEGAEGAYVARAIRDEYAPASVRAYLNLPRTRADVMPIEGDKTGRDLLHEQLDLLLDAVQDILDSTLRAGGQELLTNQRFLREKFGKVKKELDV
ncbi:hypothetical protein [Deinococcus sp. KSM4-11]|uniref:hypothetical protein n=1 Tax=Deinococcus sp. KSM4-11 TaxID=2568654 RepID=UPI001F0DED66|nr:hypothetical protein [Deinococcus sp. KSM4-11]